MNTEAIVIFGLAATALMVSLLVALFWQSMLRKEAVAECASCQGEWDQLRLLCQQQERELVELRSALRAELAHVMQLQRQVGLLNG